MADTPTPAGEAMREAVAPEMKHFDEAYWRALETSHPDNWMTAALYGRQLYSAIVKASGPIALELARLTAERDEARADQRAMLIQVGEHARARGEAEGALAISEKAGIVEGWRGRALAAEAALATTAARARREGIEEAINLAEGNEDLGCLLSDLRSALAATPPEDRQTETEWKPPAGWRLVPEEPSPGMVAAGTEGRKNVDSILAAPNTIETYRAMVAAAPPPPAIGNLDREGQSHG